MADVRFERAGKTYGEVVALSDLDLEIADGEFVVLVGPSGSGKTTALRLLAGLESISSGHVWIGDDQVDRVPPQERDIAMVFQDYALYPQMSVYKNLAFGLRMRKMPGSEIDRQVKEAAQMLGLEELLGRKPRQLSGGQRQRVALGRALVRRPQVFLMDEPLSNLDAKLRVQTRVEIARIQREFGTTTVYVTHDQTEAMTLGQRVAVMRGGALQQFDNPKALYDRPRNLFVAGFIGSPAMNLTRASVERSNGDTTLRFGHHRLPVSAQKLASTYGLDRYVGRDIVLGIRPEGLEEASLASGAPRENRLRIRVDLREDVGSDVYAYFQGGPPVEDVALKELAAEGVVPGAPASDGSGPVTFVARMSAAARVREGDHAEVVVDENALHFFDPETGLGIENERSHS